jgi:hypothetical protein
MLSIFGILRGLKNEIGHVTEKSIENFAYSKKKHIFGVKKAKGKPSEPPKNENWAPKSVWLCDTSIDREFHEVDENTYLQWSKRRK